MLDTTVILSVVGSAGVTTLVTVVNGWVTRGADGRKEKAQRRRETLRGTKATLEELLRLATMPIDSRRAPGGRNAYAENFNAQAVELDRIRFDTNDIALTGQLTDLAEKTNQYASEAAVLNPTAPQTLEQLRQLLDKARAKVARMIA